MSDRQSSLSQRIGVVWAAHRWVWFETGCSLLTRQYSMGRPEAQVVLITLSEFAMH
jgi:hypothetical protein